jgi:hypothetical protein
MNLITWGTEENGIISVSYDGSTSIVPRLAQKSKNIFLTNVLHQWGHIFGPIASELGVPLRHVAAIIWQESKGDVNARAANGDGGEGLMQITGSNKDGAGNLFGPVNNLRHGIGLMASILKSHPANDDFPALASIYNAGSPWIVYKPVPHYVPPGKEGTPSHRPWTNEAWIENGRRPEFLTHWGFCTSPGYIDSVVAAQNEYVFSSGENA